MSVGEISVIEQRLGIVFPADYRQFLLVTNGGQPKPDCVVVPDRGSTLVGVLFGIRQDRTSCDLEAEQEDAEVWRSQLPGSITIGENPGGCRFLLATIGTDAGRVYFWDRVEIWARVDGKILHPIADTFTAFVAAIQDRL